MDTKTIVGTRRYNGETSKQTERGFIFPNMTDPQYFLKKLW